MKSGRTLGSAALLLSALMLSACGETPQTASASGIKVDSPVYLGVGDSQYAVPGWKAGDRTSWQSELKARAQYGQNDYSRMSN